MTTLLLSVLEWTSKSFFPISLKCGYILRAGTSYSRPPYRRPHIITGAKHMPSACRSFRATPLTWNNRKTRRSHFKVFLTAAVLNASFLKLPVILNYLHERHCLLREIFKINWSAAPSGKKRLAELFYCRWSICKVWEAKGQSTTEKSCEFCGVCKLQNFVSVRPEGGYKLK